MSGSTTELAAAVGALAQARARPELARALCRWIAEATRADLVTLSDIAGGTGRVLLGYERGGGAFAGTARCYPIPGGSPEATARRECGRIVVSESARPLPLADLETPGGYCVVGIGTEPDREAIALLHIAGAPRGEAGDLVLLLAEVAGASLARIETAEAVAAHGSGLRELRERLRDLEDDLSEQLLPERTARDDTATAVLTQREREVFARMLTGASNTEIAAEFVVSIDTVKTHVKRILRKLGAGNRAELIARYG